MSETETSGARADEEVAAAQPAATDGGDGNADSAPDPEPEAREPRNGRGALIVAIIALIVALIAIGCAAAVWYLGARSGDRMTATMQELQQRIERQASAVDEARARVQQLQGLADAQNSQGERLQRLSQGVSEVRDGLRETRQDVAHLTDLLQTGKRSWALTEIEHLLEVANSRLNLRRDVRGAETALRLAQQQLARLRDPALYSVRKSVQESITKLHAVPVPDVEGMALTLSSLDESVSRLPLQREVPAGFEGQAQGGNEAGANAPWWQRGWHSVVGALRGVVAIRRTDKPSPALLSPRHEYFLYQNLQLKLESARLSLLQGDDAGFHVSIATAIDWLNTYFRSDAPAVKAMKSQLADLADAKLSPPLPDISAGLEGIRKRLDALNATSVPTSPPSPEKSGSPKTQPQPPAGKTQEQSQESQPEPESPPAQQSEKPPEQSKPSGDAGTAPSDSPHSSEPPAEAPDREQAPEQTPEQSAPSEHSGQPEHPDKPESQPDNADSPPSEQSDTSPPDSPAATDARENTL